jgi:RNA polymerase sigma factor (sigma-70 family)
MLRYRSAVANETRKFVGSLNSDLSAGDIEQETWIRVWTRLPGFSGSDDDEACQRMFASWLKTTTHRVGLSIIEASRAKKRGGGVQPMSLEDPIRDSAKSPSSIVRADEERTQLFDAIRAIDSDETAEIVQLHYFEGLPIAQVATRTGLNTNQVRYRLGQALKSLGRQLGD